MGKFDTLCPGCFAEKGKKKTCPHCKFDEGEVRSPLALPLRTLLNNQFLVGRVLGKPGGFGITYFGWDVKLETEIAIKEYLPRDLVGRDPNGSILMPHADEDGTTFRYGLEQFLKEARNLAKFNHPNLVRVRHFFEENQTAYLGMDYYEGCNLEEYLAQNSGKLPEEKALKITLQILDGLELVHAKNLLHRDIKPRNIYITKEGNPILLDFGAARISTGTMTRSLTVILTPGFAPYEQYYSRGLQGPWTDIYACAATLYHMVTGKVPPEAMERVKEDTFVMDDPGLSLGLLEVLQKALAQEPEQRPQSISEFKELLKKAEDSLELRNMRTITYEQPLPIEESEQIEATSPAEEDELVPKAGREKQKFPGWLWPAAFVLALVLLIIFWPETTPKNQKPADGNSENAQPDRLYAEITNDADKLFSQGNYQEAKLKYEQALVLKPGDSFITGKIEDTKKRISDLATQANRQKLYTKYTDEGNKLYNQGKYTEAKLKFEDALKQEPGDGYVTAKIEACDQRIVEAARERDRLYSKYRDEGDTFLKQGKTTEAKKSFRLALNQKPRDNYIVRRITETDRLIKQAAKTTAPEGMVKIPAGAFMMGSNDRDSDEKPVHKVSVDAFYMDKYEVTVEKYGNFLKGTGHRKPKNWSDQLQQPKRPVVYITWEDATAYTKWSGKRLPTEAEWEYAARGGNTGINGKPIYKFPWGNDASPNKANFDPDNSRSYSWKDAQKYMRDAGSYAPNKFGLYDMAGNVWEWCSDWYDKNYYQTSFGRNPRGASSGTRRVLRGGSWYNGPYFIRCAIRDRNLPADRNDDVGFRCVQDVL